MHHLLFLMMEPLSEVNLQLIMITYIPISIEMAISYYRKDGVYSFSGTFGNAISAFFGRLLAVRFAMIYGSYYVLWGVGSLFHFRHMGDTPLEILLCFVLVDLCYYIFHRMHHKFEFLWMFHYVHHSDDKLNLSTALRLSWAEQLYQFVFYIPIALIGFSPILILECYTVDSLYQIFIHDQYFTFPRWMDRIFISARLHKVHHDQQVRNQCSNIGGVFSIWDQMFGTYVPEIPADQFVAGIAGYHEQNPLRFQTDPIIAWFKRRFGKKVSEKVQ